MSPEDISLIERSTGKTLPAHYVALVTDYPARLADTEAPDFALLDDPRQIIEYNLEVRRDGYFGEQWPEHYFIIGHNGCGDYYVILLGSTQFSVGFSDHEIMECHKFAGSAPEFVEKLLQEMELP